jgi:uncharacterized protein
MIRKIILGLVALSSVMLMVTVGCSSLGRSMLFFPTHGSDSNGLTPWTQRGAFIGYCRTVDSPRNVWLMFHGNAGQASNRAYAIPSFPAEDSVFILEYPGYGNRAGAPSAASFNQAAKEAYLFLRESYPNTPVCVAGESIGSGPASTLAGLSRPPDKLVLIVPFDRLSLVARDHFPSIVVSLVLRDDWDNIRALSSYRGPIDIFGAEDDDVVPVAHARALAAAVPSSSFFLIAGGHNDWSQQGKVKIRNP